MDVRILEDKFALGKAAAALGAAKIRAAIEKKGFTRNVGRHAGLPITDSSPAERFRSA